ncbi:MAG: hypothetical protein AB1805_07420 [Nitrospirota bacterium]
MRNIIKPNTNRAKAWKVMRVMGKFSAVDIITTAGIPGANIHYYMFGLTKAGYLVKVGWRRTAGQAGAEMVYRLVRNTGPQPPILKTLHLLYDPNTNEYWSEDPEVAALAAAEAAAEERTRQLEALPLNSPKKKVALKEPVRLLSPRRKTSEADHVD